MTKRESGKERESFPGFPGIVQTGKNGNTPFRVFPFPVSVPVSLLTNILKTKRWLTRAIWKGWKG